MSASVLPEGITVYVYARTDVGMKRQGNEDSFLVADLSSGRLGLGPEVAAHQLGNQGSLMIVSDGLGGAAAGEVASAMAVQTVCTELMKTIKSVLSPNDRLKRATEQANDQIWACAQSDNSLRGMGATLTAAFIYGTSVYIAQVGDSRAYIVRGGQVKQVTEDQSWANAVKKAGLEIADVPSNVILQALGTQPKVHVEVTSVDLLNGDVLLMCSDGLSNKIKDLEMREIANGSQDLAENCRQLVDLANKRGGEDNITVILARFEGKNLSIGFEERDLSITSTFKIVTPLDFGEALEESETMSFRVEEPQAVDPMSVTQSALFDGIPTMSRLQHIPTIPNKALSKEIKSQAELPLLPTPLTSDSTSKNNEEKNSATLPLLATDPSNSASKKNLTTSERTAFRQAETKTDLPVITPVFDLSKEPIAEPKTETEAYINIEFVPTPVSEPRISSSPILPKLTPIVPKFVPIPELKAAKPNIEELPIEKPSKPDLGALPAKPVFTNPPMPGLENKPLLEKPKSSDGLSLPAKIPVSAPSPMSVAPPIISAPKLPPPPVPPAKPSAPIPLPISGAPPMTGAPILSAPRVPATKPSAPVPPMTGAPVPPPPSSTLKPPVPIAPPILGVPAPSAPKFPPPAALITQPLVPMPSAMSGAPTLPPPPMSQAKQPSAPVSPPPLFSSPPPVGGQKPALPNFPPLGQQASKLPPHPLAEVGAPSTPPLSNNLFAPPPKPTTLPVSPKLSGDGEASKTISPPAVLPSAPLNLFGTNTTSPLDTLHNVSLGLFSTPRQPKASSPNAPKADDFLENSLFSPTPPKPASIAPPMAQKPAEASLENSLFSPPSASVPNSKPAESKGESFLEFSSPGLIFPEAFKEKTSSPPKKLDDESNSIILENTLSTSISKEENKSGLLANSLFSPPNAASSTIPPPLFPPPPGAKADPAKPSLASPLFAPPVATKPPTSPNFAPPPVTRATGAIPPPSAKSEVVPGDAKSSKTGVEVLASLFSAPAPSKGTQNLETAPPVKSTQPLSMPNSLPPRVDNVAKEPIKPLPPALVLPPGPKKTDMPPMTAPPLKASVPPLSLPPKPISLPPPLAASQFPTEDDKGKWLKDTLPPIGLSAPPIKQDGEVKKAPLFSTSPSPAPSKPVSLPPPPTPGAKADLAPSPNPTPSAKAPASLPPPTVGGKQASFEEEDSFTPRAASAIAFSEVTTPPVKKGSPLNPKLLIALGGVVVVIVTVVVVIFTFFGKGDPGSTASNSPTPEATVTPVEPVETPAPTPSPVATKVAKATPKATPTIATTPEPVVPADTPGLVKYALAQVTLVLERAQKELPDTDTAKTSKLKSLGAYKEQLATYAAKNIGDNDARNFAESALSQIKGLKAQLDALPKSSSKGRRGR